LLRTIKAVQRLGFTLSEIRELLDLSEHRRGPDELHQRAQAKVAEIDARIDQLTRMDPSARRPRVVRGLRGLWGCA
jgi:DNA-binding transcriptional MerR regulator